jgi:hypothetical protein
MTLSVRAYYIDADGLEHDLPLPSDLAGVEDSRYSFYGSDRALTLGLAILPELREHAAVQVSGSQLEILRTEIAALRDSTAGRKDQEYWAFRLGNIDHAIEQAAQFGDAGWVEIA